MINTVLDVIDTIFVLQQAQSCTRIVNVICHSEVIFYFLIVDNVFNN